MRCSQCGHGIEPQDTGCPNCGASVNADPDNRFKAAMSSVADGDLENAIGLLEECLEIDPDHLTGRFNLGVALSLADRCDQAIGHLYYVMTQDADYPGIYTALGEAAFGSYLYHEEQANLKSVAMVQLFRQAIERDPEDVDAHFSLGNAFVALGMGEQALQPLRRALELDRCSPAVHYMLAKAYMMIDRFDEAKAMARKALSLATPEEQYLDEIERLLAELREGVVHTEA